MISIRKRALRTTGILAATATLALGLATPALAGAFTPTIDIDGATTIHPGQSTTVVFDNDGNDYVGI